MMDDRRDQRPRRVGQVRGKLDLELIERQGARSARSCEDLRQCRTDEVRGDLIQRLQDLVGHVAARHRVDHVADHARYSQL